MDQDKLLSEALESVRAADEARRTREAEERAREAALAELARQERLRGEAKVKAAVASELDQLVETTASFLKLMAQHRNPGLRRFKVREYRKASQDLPSEWRLEVVELGGTRAWYVPTPREFLLTPSGTMTWLPGRITRENRSLQWSPTSAFLLDYLVRGGSNELAMQSYARGLATVLHANGIQA